MKRSMVNDILRYSDTFIRSHGVSLPPFAYFTPEQMHSDDNAWIRSRGMGWDITDYGSHNFSECGLFLFTARNGDINALSEGKGMLYAEKIMISRKGQLSPMHRHHHKVEDIINRAGGRLVLRLHPANDDPEGSPDPSRSVWVRVDGHIKKIEAGEHLRLDPGQSVTLTTDIWHAFWAEDGDCLIGEVSTVNDDCNDNLFADPVGRFSNIEEDEDKLHLLVSDY